MGMHPSAGLIIYTIQPLGLHQHWASGFPASTTQETEVLPTAPSLLLLLQLALPLCPSRSTPPCSPPGVNLESSQISLAGSPVIFRSSGPLTSGHCSPGPDKAVCSLEGRDLWRKKKKKTRSIYYRDTLGSIYGSNTKR